MVNGENEKKREAVNTGVFLEILTLLESANGLASDKLTFNEEILKIILDNLIRKYGIDVLFHVKLCRVEKECRNISLLKFAGLSGEISLKAHYYIDSTGDGVLASLAGCPFCMGRDSDGACKPMSVMFRLGNVKINAESV